MTRLPPAPRVDERRRLRTGRLAGSIAGLIAGALTAMAFDGAAGAPVLAIHVGACAVLGLVFGLLFRLSSGFELTLRGLAFGAALWALLQVVPTFRPALHPSLLEALSFGALLGTRAPVARWLLRRGLARPRLPVPS